MYQTPSMKQSPKCNGFLRSTRDQFGLYVSCINCGFVDYVEYEPTPTPNIPASRGWQGNYPDAHVFQAGKIRVDYVVDGTQPRPAEVISISGWPRSCSGKKQIQAFKRKMELRTGRRVIHLEAAVRIALTSRALRTTPSRLKGLRP